MVVVPAGSFTMGSPPSEEGRHDNEGPQRRVTIGRPFAVGQFSVTVDQFARFVKETGFALDKSCTQWDGRSWAKKVGSSFLAPGFHQSGAHPAVCVSWHDAQRFVAWLSRKTGKTYRMPTEAEREYVTRAGATTPFWWVRRSPHNKPTMRAT